MNTLFILSLLILLIIFLNRRRLAVFMTSRSGKKQIEQKPDDNDSGQAVCYRIFAYNAKDYPSTKDLENAMELRLEQCVAGLAKQGHKAEVNIYSGGFVIICLVRYSY